jgi:high-affinity K+ transport system ATPase subunit B
MVTGDNIETAKAIARECNILTDDGMAVEGPVFRTWTESEMIENAPKLQVPLYYALLLVLVCVIHLVICIFSSMLLQTYCFILHSYFSLPPDCLLIIVSSSFVLYVCFY